jgi:microcompartment protein CcmK/EutM
VAVEVQGRAWEEVAREATARGAARALLVREQAVVVREHDGREHIVAFDEVAAGTGEELP